jgi:hypothetical protein
LVYTSPAGRGKKKRTYTNNPHEEARQDRDQPFDEFKAVAAGQELLGDSDQDGSSRLHKRGLPEERKDGRGREFDHVPAVDRLIGKLLQSLLTRHSPADYWARFRQASVRPAGNTPA